MRKITLAALTIGIWLAVAVILLPALAAVLGLAVRAFRYGAGL